VLLTVDLRESIKRAARHLNSFLSRQGPPKR
jgi:hypothetical protein